MMSSDVPKKMRRYALRNCVVTGYFVWTPLSTKTFSWRWDISALRPAIDKVNIDYPSAHFLVSMHYRDDTMTTLFLSPSHGLPGCRNARRNLSRSSLKILSIMAKSWSAMIPNKFGLTGLTEKISSELFHRPKFSFTNFSDRAHMLLAGATATSRLLSTAGLAPSPLLSCLFLCDQCSHHRASIGYNLLLEVWCARWGG